MCLWESNPLVLVYQTNSLTIVCVAVAGLSSGSGCGKRAQRVFRREVMGLLTLTSSLTRMELGDALEAPSSLLQVRCITSLPTQHYTTRCLCAQMQVY